MNNFHTPRSKKEAKPLDYGQAQKRALNLLAVRDRADHEMRQRLADAGAPAEVIESVIEWLYEMGLLNDAEFGQTYARSVHGSKGFARGRIERELRAKGLSEQDVSSATLQISDEEEWDRARQLAYSRYRSLANLDSEVARRRLYGFLMRKGYPHSIVMGVVAEVINHDESSYT